MHEIFATGRKTAVGQSVNLNITKWSTMKNASSKHNNSSNSTLKKFLNQIYNRVNFHYKCNQYEPTRFDVYIQRKRTATYMVNHLFLTFLTQYQTFSSLNKEPTELSVKSMILTSMYIILHNQLLLLCS